ncbi:MAG: hypothetical protein MUF14_11380 [Hyphomonadaceae bacterium]|jgi:hypothetical protein|nr:hypothetical protein [Hyphomonadaceae bacterium]
MDEHYATLLDRLERGELGPTGFGHHDHVGVAVAALRRYGFFRALMIVAEGIETAASRAGAPDKFNATITLASMSQIAQLLDHWGDGPIAGFVEAYADALAPHALARHYGEETLASPLARRIGLLPGDPMAGARRCQPA